MTASPLPAGMHVFERGWLSSNNILFTDGEQTLMVDSGYCTHADQTLSLVRTALAQRPLDALINTHLHSDHCGGNAALQNAYPQLQTIIPPGQAAQVRHWDPVALFYSPTGQLCPRFTFTQTLQPGMDTQFGKTRWEAHAAAGHDPHALLFFEPADRILISADALWENGFGVVFPELEGDGAFAEVALTLDLIERLKPATVIPGHGRVFAYSPAILASARQRLAAFVQNPHRHARHAAKVLLKFKLLEMQRLRYENFLTWACATPYLMQIGSKFFTGVPASIWIGELCDELVTAGAAQRSDGHIANA